ncbi:MAG: hypothetical protein K2H86_06680 [Muribaculaceae bacterium]|nr:hypothetical protein [Muribaculaceae bacterium]
MKKIYPLILASIVISCIFTGCDKLRGRAYAPETPMDSTLVIYYSQNGATRAVAEELRFQLGCDIAEVKPVRPYNGDYDATVARMEDELQYGGVIDMEYPDIDYAKYKTIFIGTPIWGGKCSLPIYSLINEHYWVGKKIFTFCTYGSGGLDSMTRQVADTQKDCTIICGFGIENDSICNAPEIIHRYLDESL